MPVYELAIASTTTTVNTPFFEILSPTRPAEILEIGMFPAATQIWSVRRPSNTPAGGTAQNADETSDLSGAGVSSLGLILAGWSTAPTIDAGGWAVACRNPTAGVNTWGQVLGFLPGELVVGPTRNQSALVWADQAPSAGARLYLRWEE